LLSCNPLTFRKTATVLCTWTSRKPILQWKFCSYQGYYNSTGEIRTRSKVWIFLTANHLWGWWISHPARLLAIACHRRLSPPATFLWFLNPHSSVLEAPLPQLQIIEFCRRSCSSDQPDQHQSSYQPGKPWKTQSLQHGLHRIHETTLNSFSWARWAVSSWTFEENNLNKPLRSSASGRWNLFIHVHHGIIEVSKTTGSLLLDDSGLHWSHFLLLASEKINKACKYMLSNTIKSC